MKRMHWHLDVAFWDAANRILDKLAVPNLDIIRKWSLSILKMIELSKPAY